MDASSGTLEALDKETLMGLARQLDLKVSARLRKADLVAMIEAKGAAPHGDHTRDSGPQSSSPRTSGEPSNDTPSNNTGGVGSAEQTTLRQGEERSATAQLSFARSNGTLVDDHQRVNGRSSEAGAGERSMNENGAQTHSRRSTGSSDPTTGPKSSEGHAKAGSSDTRRNDGRGGLATLIPPITVNPGERSNGSQAEESQSAVLARGEDNGSRRSRRNRRGKDRVDRPEGSDNQQSVELTTVEGVLDLRDDGYGFLRTKGYLSSKEDVYVPAAIARRMSLRRGDIVVGAARPASSTEKYPALARVDTVSGLDPEAAKGRRRFEDLTPLFPNERLTLETSADPTNITPRIIDLIAPIGKGQRGLIVSPPKAGKTTIMKEIANAIERNNPDVALIVLLVDERPEEVTDFRRSVKGEVIASTFDRPAEEHTQVAELTIERAKRMVELGLDVVVILDGITRLARAYNLAQPASGRIMSGGIDSGALYPPKKFFGAARNIEEGGSLTILATALVENGSKMDEVIFEEVKGTGNMELKLDRRLSERRLYPAVDVNGSSTRHEELLFSRDHLNQIWKLRRVLNAITQDGTAAAGLELLLDKVRSTRSNGEFLAEIARSSGM
jgi:transcription termination factor Rho